MTDMTDSQKLDQILKNQGMIYAVVEGSSPPPDTSTEAWYKSSTGQDLRNPDWEGDDTMPGGWDESLWDISHYNDVVQVDVSYIPVRYCETPIGSMVTKYGNDSYSLLKFPKNPPFGVGIRSSGQNVLRFLDPTPLSNGRHVVLATATLGGGGMIYPESGGAVSGTEVWVLQCSNQVSCGSQYTEDTWS